tara:strand:+ start:1596 stop:2333 length:738 start_codon:yes stop_codon:yes gene_type:complete
MKEIKISVLCPTRGRPQLMQRVVEKCLETCSDSSQIEIVFGIDDDDIKSIEKAKELQKQFSSDNIEYTVWPRKKYIFSDLINQCSKAASGEIFNLMSDDAVHDSKDWDNVAIGYFNRYPDKIILLQTVGGVNPKTSFPFMHKNWRTAAGYLLPPTFSGDWADYWITDVASELPGRRFVQSDIVISHLHAEMGLMEKDQTYHEHYQERMEQEALPKSEHPYHGGKGKEMKRLEIENLTNFINNYEG